MKPQLPDGQSDLNPADAESCSVCRELLANLGRFVEMIETTRASFRSEWLTVEEIAQELKLSKSIVYRLIRNGELEAVDLVVGEEGQIARKGHYRVKRSALNGYLEGRRVKPLPQKPARFPGRRLPKVRNHLGL